MAGFLLFERSFPRSVLHNLDRARGLLMRLREGEAAGRRSPSWEALEKLRGSILQLDIEEVRKLGLHETLTWMVDETALLCNAIHDEYVDPPLDALRARVHRVPALQSQRQSGSGSQGQAQQQM